MAKIVLHKGPPVEATALNLFFIHGLGGDAEGTWTDASTKKYWPDWVDTISPSIRVWTIEYSADVLGDALTLSQAANNVLTTIQSKRDDLPAPFAFVCHSLGGLVLKRALQIARQEDGDDHTWFLAQMEGALFLGTPHSGSIWATRLRFLLPGLTGGALFSLGKDRENLLELRDWFIQAATKHDWAGRAVLELFRTRLPWLPILGIYVVTSESGRDGYSKTIFGPYDHFGLAKPSSQDDDQHMSLRVLVRDIVRRRAVEAAKLAADAAAPRSVPALVLCHKDDPEPKGSRRPSSKVPVVASAVFALAVVSTTLFQSAPSFSRRDEVAELHTPPDAGLDRASLSDPDASDIVITSALSRSCVDDDGQVRRDVGVEGIGSDLECVRTLTSDRVPSIAPQGGSIEVYPPRHRDRIYWGVRYSAESYFDCVCARRTDVP